MSGKKLLISIITILAIIFVSLLIRPKTENASKIIFENGKEITIEIADTQLSRAQGLMFRKNLPENKGMLFIFEKSESHVFWMKNTQIPLDIVWMDENFKVVDITYNATPCKPEEKCAMYSPKKPAKYVLEINAGSVEKNGLQLGNTIVVQKDL